MTRRAGLADAGWALLLTLAVVGPLWLGRGFWLVGDMVFVPHQPWKPAWLGLDGSLPRSVPMDAILSALAPVVPGEVQQRLLLTGGLLLGGIGIARLVRSRAAGAPWPARAAAVALFLWNPWVAEHLAIGQWAILLGYLLLPWVGLAARRLRADRRDAGPAAVVLVLAAVCSPSSGVMGAVTLLVLAATRATWWRILVMAVVANLSWVVPAIGARTADVSTTGVFTGFAARAESSAGVLASLLSLGGTWKSSIVPDARTSVAVVLLACVLSLVALGGLARHDDRGEGVRLAALGGLALGVALLPALPGGDTLLEHVAAHVPPLALLRDSHRFLAPLALTLAVGVSGATTEIARRAKPGREAVHGLVGLLVLAPVLLLPGLAWGLGGQLHRSTYPAAWEAVADRIAAQPGTTVVLPWHGAYRGFAWAHGRALLDPAPRLLPGEVLVDDRTYLDDRVVPAEDPRSEPVRAALATADPVAALRALGVRWVLVEAGTTAQPSVADLVGHGARGTYAGEGLALLDLGPGTTRNDYVSTIRRDQILAGDLCVLAMLALGTAWILRVRE